MWRVLRPSALHAVDGPQRGDELRLGHTGAAGNAGCLGAPLQLRRRQIRQIIRLRASAMAGASRLNARPSPLQRLVIAPPRPSLLRRFRSTRNRVGPKVPRSKPRSTGLIEISRSPSRVAVLPDAGVTPLGGWKVAAPNSLSSDRANYRVRAAGSCSPVKIAQALDAPRRASIAAAALRIPETSVHARCFRACFFGSAVTTTHSCLMSWPSAPSCWLTTAPFVGTVPRLPFSSHLHFPGRATCQFNGLRRSLAGCVGRAAAGSWR
jgi:hypothetical protein